MKTLKLTTILFLTIMSILLVSPKASASDNTQGIKNGIVVYYFHGNQRCYTCKNIEELSKAATQKLLSDNSDNNAVKFVSVNVEEDSNEHFIEDYQLIVRSVVIAKVEDGNETGWRRLDKVWSLHKDPEQFLDYFNNEIAKLQNEEN